MIVGVDGNEANVEKKVGVGKYAFEVLQHLWQIKNKNLNFKIYLKGEPLPDLPKETDWWQYKVVGPKKFWTQIGLPFALYKDSHYRGRQIKVFFTPTHYAPRFCPCPRVISIMDLSFLHFPEMFRQQDLWQLKSWTAYSIKKAVKILTISRASKDDIIKYYQVPEEKVVVTYPGFDMMIKDKGYKIKDEVKKYGIDGDYILSVGTLQPRKNFVKLIEAFHILISSYPHIDLVIVGKKGWLYEEILEAPKKFGIENKVKFLDFVQDSDLPALYRNAKCFVLVSLYEGFGLPVLEAMAYGCPVVVSNVSSLPEVVGEAGIMVDPNNVEEITDKLLKALRMSEEERQETIKKGFEQAKKFSWEKCARQTLEVLKEVANKK